MTFTNFFVLFLVFAVGYLIWEMAHVHKNVEAADKLLNEESENDC